MNAKELIDRGCPICKQKIEKGKHNPYISYSCNVEVPYNTGIIRNNDRTNLRLHYCFTVAHGTGYALPEENTVFTVEITEGKYIVTQRLESNISEIHHIDDDRVVIAVVNSIIEYSNCWDEHIENIMLL